MTVCLRPVEPGDDPFLEWLRRPEVTGEFNSFDEPLPPGNQAADRMVVALDDGTPVGVVSWFAVSYGPNLGSRAWNMGITIAPGHRRKGYGAAAQRLLADHLLSTTEANRVEASTDVENVAEQRALERAGFRREGVARGAQFRRSRWHDLVIYARLRDDPS